ncbi:DedA family protein [Deinococcus hohokamensis]|uniref:DedA family protein n=1 Tax=Deinococcus hohokamensis TaxID=309883 RepID=A0ABV9I521_9DEIO
MDALIHSVLAFSYAGLFLIVFAETGLLLGLILPGDSLLIVAGILAASGGAGHLNLGGVMAAVVGGALLGSLAGYLIGRRFGPQVFRREQSRFFRPEYLTQAQHFFDRYGALAVIAARFVPFVRTIVPTLAGVSGMRARPFGLHSLIGAVLWGAGLPALAYLLGQRVPHLDRYVLLIVGAVLAISIVPVLLKVVQARRVA